MNPRPGGLMQGVRFFAGVTFAVILAGGTALAQTAPGSTDLRARQEVLYAALLEQPDNLDLMFQHALISIQLGDFEAAINTLERMVIFNPELYRAKVELGAAYFQLGAYENARYYFDDVITNGNPPPEVRRRVNTFIEAIDKRTQTSGFAGMVTFGVAYSTNANLGPRDSNVQLLGRPAILEDQFVESDDIGFRATARGRHFYDPGRPNGDLWLTDAGIYSLHYLDETDGDIDGFSIATGPRLSLDDQLFGPKIRPFLSGELVSSGNDLLYYGGGAGAEYTDTVNSKVNVFAVAEGKWREYDTRNDFDGFNGRVASGFGWTPIDPATFTTVAYFETDQARKDYFTNYEFGIRQDITYRYDSGLSFTDQLWSVNVYGAVTRRLYKDEDELVNPDKKRKDTDLRVGISHIFHIMDGWFIQADADYLYRDSNLPNFDLENFGAGLSVGLEF